MIVVGRQARRGREQYGSSTIGDEIVRHAVCPVTVVPVPILDRPLGESALGDYLRSARARQPSTGEQGPGRATSTRISIESGPSVTARSQRQKDRRKGMPDIAHSPTCITARSVSRNGRPGRVG
jgi:hypothetical protein